MGLFDSLFGNVQQRQDFEDFANRYDQGDPWDGYSDDEVRDRYGSVTRDVPDDVYYQSAQESFARLTPEQRMQFAQYMQQEARRRNLNYQEFDRPSDDERFQDPDFLAQAFSGMRRREPNFLEQMMGGGGAGYQSGAGDLLSNPLAKAAVAGIAAIALKKMMGGRQ